MKSDVPFHDFGHQPVERTAASGHQLQDSGAILVGVERSLDGVDLSTNPANAG